MLKGSSGKGGGRAPAPVPTSADVIARAFTLALVGSTADLASMVRSGAVEASLVRPDGMFRTWSLLHAAASKGHTACVLMLLSEGAEKAPLNAQGKTPAQLAEAKGFSELAALIEGSHGAQDEFGRDIGLRAKVAAVATADTDEDALATLLDRAVSLRLLSESKADALTDAVASGKADEAALLTEWGAKCAGSSAPPAIAPTPPTPKAPATIQAAPLAPALPVPASAPLQPSRTSAPPPAPSPAPPPVPSPTPSPKALPPAPPAPPPATTQPREASDACAVFGTLMEMCSELEARDREMCLELSPLEVLAGTESLRRPQADLAKTVKKYQRPAAGAPPPAATSLRPLPVLERTVDFLLKTWASRTDMPALSRYLFVSDRLRAVQQDMTVQRLHCAPLLARIVRFHLLAEVHFCTLAHAAAAGFSAVQNRSLLCNALITFLESSEAATGRVPAPLHAELLAYFILLHAEEPDTVATQLECAPAPTLAHAAIRRALAAMGAYGREAPEDLGRTLRSMRVLEVACLVRLLPCLRALTMRHLNAAFKPNEAFAAATLTARLWLVDAADAARCAKAHGLSNAPTAPPGAAPAGEAAAAAAAAAADASAPPLAPWHFHTGSFVLTPKAAIEPPLPPPNVPAIQRWRESQEQPRVAATAAPAAKAPAVALAEGNGTAMDCAAEGTAVALKVADAAPEAGATAEMRKKKNRRPPPASLLADTPDDAPPSAAEWLWALLHDGVELELGSGRS